MKKMKNKWSMNLKVRFLSEKNSMLAKGAREDTIEVKYKISKVKLGIVPLNSRQHKEKLRK